MAYQAFLRRPPTVLEIRKISIINIGAGLLEKFFMEETVTGHLVIFVQFI